MSTVRGIVITMRKKHPRGPVRFYLGARLIQIGTWVAGFGFTVEAEE